MTLISNVRIVDCDNDFIGSVRFGEKIETISKDALIPTEGETVIDGTGKIVMPGVIDPHVHFRDPGFEHKENFQTGSMSAAAGGVTGIFDMPNTNPCTFTMETLEQKRKIAEERSIVNFGLYFGAGPDNLEEIRKDKNVPGTKLYLNTTTGNLKMDDEEHWRQIFAIGKKVSLHAEGETFVRAIEIWEEENMPCDLHLCHMSLRQELALIQEVRKRIKNGKRLTCEVCPHHLFMTGKERLKYGAFCCMKPPLATQDDVDALWEGIESDDIDFFATDHAPHTREEKELSNQTGEPVYGIPGVETLLPLIFSEFKKRNWDLSKLSRMMSRSVVENFDIKDSKGLIKEGFDSDLVLLDPNVKCEIEGKKMHSKCDWSAYEGRAVHGQVLQTWVRGGLVWNGEKFEKGFGKEFGFGEK